MMPEPRIEDLSAYLDHEVTGTARQEMEAHLASCETCRRRLDALSATVNAIHELPIEAPSRAFTIPAQREQPRRWAPVLGWAGGAAAAAVVAIVAFNGLSHMPGSGASTTASQYTAPTEHQSGAGVQAGVAQPNDKSALSASALPNRASVVDSRTPSRRLLVATNAARYGKNETMEIQVTAQGPSPVGAVGDLEVFLIRDGSGVSLRLAVDSYYGPPVYSGSFKLSDLALPQPSVGTYRLVVIWALRDQPGVILTTEVPVTISN
jgi:anti-sigma factor RsiW